MTQIKAKGINVTNITDQEFGDRLKVTYVLVGIFLLIVLDILTNFLFKIPEPKLIFKTMLASANLLLMGYLVYFVWNKFNEDDAIKSDLTLAREQAQANAHRFEEKASQLTDKFDEYISHKFDAWQLSPSEKEVAFFLLSGKSSKQIAEQRFTSERTIRNQCGFIYDKSGCAGRNEFAAYFFKSFVKNSTPIT